jgi:hypothetical protein
MSVILEPPKRRKREALESRRTVKDLKLRNLRLNPKGFSGSCAS